MSGVLLVPAAAGAATYTVTSTDNSGPGTLRQAVIDANAQPNSDEIVFADSIPANLAIGAKELGPIEISTDLRIKGPGPKRLQLLNNRNPNLGGRIFNVAAGASPTISGLAMIGVSIGADGGAIRNRGDLTLKNIVATLCLAYGDTGTDPIAGGAIANSGKLRISNSDLSGNQALGNDGVPARGGAISNDGGLVTLDSVSLTRNSADSSATALGGGIASDGGTLAIVETTLERNTATGKGDLGAGGAIASSGDLSLAASTLSANRVVGGGSGAFVSAGGGLYNFAAGQRSGVFRILDSTITGNSADIDTKLGIGGGIADVTTMDWEGPSSGFVGTTIAGNSAGRSGANLYSRTPGLTVLSTIIADPSGSDSCDVAPPSVWSAGYNIDSGHSCALRKPTDRPDTDPKLKPLADNGGPTRTMAIGTSSPALDQGLAAFSSHDQRGEKRPVRYPGAPPIPPGGDGTDIGAYELQVPPSTGLRRIVGDVRPGKADVGSRTCFHFRAERRSGAPLPGVKVKLGGKQAKTGGRGKARICKTFGTSGRRAAKMRKPGFAETKLPIRVR